MYKQPLVSKHKVFDQQNKFFDLFTSNFGRPFLVDGLFDRFLVQAESFQSPVCALSYKFVMLMNLKGGRITMGFFCAKFFFS
jgi:hypothetical protein